MKTTNLSCSTFNLKFFSILTLILFSTSGFSQTEKWSRFNTAFSEYISNPTHENSIKASELLPNGLNRNDLPAGKVADNIWLSALKLEEMIIAENRDALKLGFRLFMIADGESAELLEIAIGKLINKNPLLFLQELKNNRHCLYSINGFVGNYGQDFVDNDKLRLAETNKRIKSLKKIADSDLIEIRDECLAKL